MVNVTLSGKGMKFTVDNSRCFQVSFFVLLLFRNFSYVLTDRLTPFCKANYSKNIIIVQMRRNLFQYNYQVFCHVAWYFFLLTLLALLDCLNIYGVHSQTALQIGLNFFHPSSLSVLLLIISSISKLWKTVAVDVRRKWSPHWLWHQAQWRSNSDEIWYQSLPYSS